jgi:hypothetical protein
MMTVNQQLDQVSQRSHRRPLAAFPVGIPDSPLPIFNRQKRHVEQRATNCKQSAASRSNRQKTRHRRWRPSVTPSWGCTFRTADAEDRCALADLVCYSRPRTRVPPGGPARQRPRSPRRAGAFPYFRIEKEPRIPLSGTLGSCLALSAGPCRISGRILCAS